ncbi:MAG: methyltransferase domain-containing protein [Chloroflexota bacterium]|nr:methyltransferase domain-containing protein [Chloroflexota bacterium]
MTRIFQLIRHEPSSTCLNVGGPTTGFLDVARYFGRKLIVLNIKRQDLVTGRRDHYGDLDCELIESDATQLPFADRSVDCVLSVTLIEHLPRSQRPAFAREVVRVARKGLFITAPNYWFPFEPHYKMPLFQFIPEALKRGVVARTSIGSWPCGAYEPVSLPTTKELRRLFPGAHVEGLRWTLVPETLIVWHKEEGQGMMEGMN